MIPVSCVLLVLALLFTTPLALGDLTPEDCGDIQHDVENGMIRLPDFSGIRDINCSWTYTAPAGRKLLVKVDSVHLPPLDLRTSQLQLYVDDTFYDIPRNCVKCLRQMVGGKVLTVVFTSYAVQDAERNENETSDGMGSFQIRYKAFDPHRCSKTETIENGYVVNKGRKLGQTVFYHCNPPYDLVGDSDLQCKVMEDSPLPVWSSKAPKCVIQDCTEEPVVRKGSSGAIASPGYPTYIYQFTSPCVWEIIAQTSQQIKVSVTYLKFPKQGDNSFTENNSKLLLLDGESNQNILNLTEPISNNPVNFTTLTSKLTVQFVVEADSKNKEEIGFYMEYSMVSSSCPKPRPPVNGNVIGYSADLGSTVSYRCKQGFVLVGVTQAECLFNRQWSHPTPSCEAISESLPPSFTASNDSDTVTDRLDEIPLVEDYSATDFIASKEGWNFTEAKEVSTLASTFLKTSPPVQTSDSHTSKKSEKDNGNGVSNKSTTFIYS